jgi:hypothetical protein
MTKLPINTWRVASKLRVARMPLLVATKMVRRVKRSSFTDLETL